MWRLICSILLFPESSAAQETYCDVCNIDCKTPKALLAHTKSTTHILKASESGTMETVDDRGGRHNASVLKDWGRDKMAAIFQTTYSNAFSWMEIFKLQLTIFQHWFIYWLGADQATSHYPNQWKSAYSCIYASLCLNELNLWMYVSTIIYMYCLWNVPRQTSFLVINMCYIHVLIDSVSMFHTVGTASVWTHWGINKMAAMLQNTA